MFGSDLVLTLVYSVVGDNDDVKCAVVVGARKDMKYVVPLAKVLETFPLTASCWVLKLGHVNQAMW